MRKDRNKTRIAVIACSTIVGVGAGIGVGFVPQFKTLLNGNGLAMFSTIFALLLGLVMFAISFFVSKILVGKHQEKAQMNSWNAKSAMATGQVPLESSKAIVAEQKRINKELNKKNARRRVFEKHTKNDY